MMGIGDLERMASKVALGRISPRETRVIAHSLRSTAQIASLLSKAEGEELHRMAERFETNEEIILDIEQTLTDEPPIALGRGAVIASGINEELDELRNLSSERAERLAFR